ncbi:MAG: hypothetical protein R3B69_03475 [Candidatus Paceibacterota bacterium]
MNSALKNITQWSLSIFISAVVALAVSTAISYYVTNDIQKNEVERSVTQQTALLDFMESEYSRLADFLARVQENESFRNDIVERDILSLTTTVNNFKEQDKIGLFVVTDQEGVVLTRARFQGQRGDYFYDTTPHGAKVGSGEDVKMILNQGDRLPLILVAGTPLYNATDSQIGAALAAQDLSDEFAQQVVRDVLHDDGELLFYEPHHGVVGSSFSSEESSNVKNAFLGAVKNFGDDIETLDAIELNGVTYQVTHIPFAVLDGWQETTGGMVVFTERESYNFLITWLMAFLLTCFLLALLSFVLRDRETKLTQLLLCLVIAFIVTSKVVYWFQVNDSGAQDITDQTYPIYNATISFAPNSGIIDRDFEQRVSVLIESSGEPINAAGVQVDFDPTMIEVVDIVDNGGFCDAGFVVGREIDNENGTALYQCGTLSPIRGETATFMELVIKPLATGNAELRFNEQTGVYANDGLGTNVLRTRTNASYQVREGGDGLIMFSQSHPNTTNWYNDTNARFSWRTTDSGTYYYTLSREQLTSRPGNVVATTDNSLTLPLPEDGIFYFHLWTDDDVTSAPIIYKIQSDKTPPTAPIVNASKKTVTPGELIRIELGASDATSGIERPYYYISYNNGIFFPVQSPFYTALPSVGRHNITIRAFDNAGNYTDTTLAIQVVPGGSQSFFGGPAAVIEALSGVTR